MTDFTITADFPRPEIEFDARFSHQNTPRITYIEIPWDLNPLSEYFVTTGAS